MTTTTEKRIRKPRPKAKVKITVKRVFTGGKSITDAFIPIIADDLRNRIQQIRTIDNTNDSL